MAKISKRLLGKHNQAVELLKKEELNYDEIDFVYENYHEGAGKMNNLISAHFTPREIAQSINQNAREENFVDLGAGIGILSHVAYRYWQGGASYDEKPPTGVCIERCTEYFEVGKKLLPQFHWINGDIFDPKVIAEVKSIMKGLNFSIIANPPYGRQVKTDTKDLLKYTGSVFEYKAIELGAILGAYDGAYLIPQTSAPFRMTSNQHNGSEHDSYKTPEYKKFVKQTGLEIATNMGYHTEISDEENGWKDVSITTEIACVEFDELNYKPKTNITASQVVNSTIEQAKNFVRELDIPVIPYGNKPTLGELRFGVLNEIQGDKTPTTSPNEFSAGEQTSLF